MRPFALLLALAVFASGLGNAQAAAAGRPGPRAILPRGEESALARSAQPGSARGDARIYVFTDQGFGIADSGRSGVACLVNRSWPGSLEPSCFDPEAAATVMQMEMERTRLFHQGRAADEVER